MNKVLFFILISVSLFAQNVSVVNVEQLTEKGDGSFFYPSASASGNMVLLTSDSYKGLWLLDVETKNITKLNEYPGAGYNPVFSAGEMNVIYRKDDYSSRLKQSSIISQNVSTMTESVIEPAARNISEVYLMPNGTASYIKDDNLRSAAASGAANSSLQNSPAVFIENGGIAVYNGGSKKIIKPMGEGHYIWPSVSPDGNMLLFTAAGKGTFISDLNGNIITNLGYANAPEWSPDGKYVVYMNDKDDGHRLISSDIYIVKADGTGRTKLTGEGGLEIYPAWLGLNKVVYSTADGIVYSIELKFE